MQNSSKWLLVVSLILVAFAVASYTMGWFAKPVGASISVEARCPKCQNVTHSEMSHILKNGWNDAESGWFIKCPKCGEPASVRTSSAWQQSNPTPKH